MGDREEKVAMLSLGWYVLFSFRKQARERKGRRVRGERRRIQIPIEYDFFFPAGSFQKADVMWGMLKRWFVVNSPGKRSRGGKCSQAVCVGINIPGGEQNSLSVDAKSNTHSWGIFPLQKAAKQPTAPIIPSSTESLAGAPPLSLTPCV